ncbi:MAG: 50S ribosomal protein L6 [Thiomargarita sp.]|nr:50S ribosomal protein L6 [Thiomargarita sp.]
MSRIAKNPVSIPNEVTVQINEQKIQLKGNKGTTAYIYSNLVEIKLVNNTLQFAPLNDSKKASALAGTTRALVNNMVQGVNKGFEKTLSLVGVGYRAQLEGKTLNLTLGYSHPIHFNIPESVTIETPTQTSIVIKGIDKQQVGQIAANIRAFRKPEPYKGKGVRYADEEIILKEAKKK